MPKNTSVDQPRAAGKYDFKNFSTPERSLTEEVADNFGETTVVTRGHIDDAAKYVYRNGQCLALAAAVSKATGWPIVLRISDEDGTPFLHHAWVEDPNGDLIDIYGLNDREAVDDQYDGSYERTRMVTIDELPDLFVELADTIPAQDHDTAASFVDPVMSAWAEDAAEVAAR